MATIRNLTIVRILLNVDPPRDSLGYATQNVECHALPGVVLVQSRDSQYHDERNEMANTGHLGMIEINESNP
jgi:hypothetical protein